MKLYTPTILSKQRGNGIIVTMGRWARRSDWLHERSYSWPDSRMSIDDWLIVIVIGLFLYRQVHREWMRGVIFGVVKVVEMSRYTHTPAIFLQKQPFWGGKLAVRPLKYGTPISSRKTGHRTAKQGRCISICLKSWFWGASMAQTAKVWH